MPATQRVQRDRSSRPTALFALEAQQLLARGEARQAVELCKRGLAYYPTNPTGYVVLAQSYIQMEQKERALNVLQDGYRRTGSDRLNELALELSGERSPATEDEPGMRIDYSEEILPEPVADAESLADPLVMEEIPPFSIDHSPLHEPDHGIVKDVADIPSNSSSSPDIFPLPEEPADLDEPREPEVVQEMEVIAMEIEIAEIEPEASAEPKISATAEPVPAVAFPEAANDVMERSSLEHLLVPPAWIVEESFVADEPPGIEDPADAAEPAFSDRQGDIGETPDGLVVAEAGTAYREPAGTLDEMAIASLASDAVAHAEALFIIPSVPEERSLAETSSLADEHPPRTRVVEPEEIGPETIVAAPIPLEPVQPITAASESLPSEPSSPEPEELHGSLPVTEPLADLISRIFPVSGLRGTPEPIDEEPVAQPPVIEDVQLREAPSAEKEIEISPATPADERQEPEASAETISSSVVGPPPAAPPPHPIEPAQERPPLSITSRQTERQEPPPGERRDNIVSLGSRREPTPPPQPIEPQRPAFPPLRTVEGKSAPEMEPQRTPGGAAQGMAQERPRSLALHMGKNISRLRSSNLRLIPGLEFAPLRHEDQARKQSIAPLINEPMPMPIADPSFRTQRPLEEKEIDLPPLPPLVGENGGDGQLQIGIREPEILPPPVLEPAPVREELPSEPEFLPLAEPQEETEPAGEPTYEPEPSAETEAFDGNILQMVQAVQKSSELTPLEELARRLENARIPVVEEATEHRPVFTTSIVSETLANILVSQGAYAEALKAFQTLARTKPERFDYFQERIWEMKWRINNPDRAWPPEEDSTESTDDAP